MALRPDLAIIAGAVPAATRVLDVGCGDGDLIAALRDKGVDARGLEIDAANVTAAIARGQSVVQGDGSLSVAVMRPSSQIFDHIACATRELSGIE